MVCDLRNTPHWIEINKSNNEPHDQRHFNPIEYLQCPEHSATPALFISDTTSTEVIKGTLLSEVRVATVRTCKSSVKGVWVYHL